MESFGIKPKIKQFGNRPCRFCNAPNWSPIHKCPALEANCNKCGKKGHFAKACRQRTYNNQTVKRLTEDETQQPNESISESEESIHHIKEIKAIEEENKHYTATIKINGVKKDFIIDTGSPITIVRPDERITKHAEIQKVTNRYQDVNKNEVKFREKVPVNIEYEKNKQKMEILITEGTDIISLLGMDWMKTFRLTIGRIQLAENNQSEKKRIIKISGPIWKQPDKKDTEIKIQLKPGHFPVKQKARPVPLHLQENVGRELEKLIKSGHLEKMKDVDEDCFVSPAVITVKSDKSVRIALDSWKLNDSCIKMRPHMPNMEELLYQVLVEITCDRTMQLFMSNIDMDYADLSKYNNLTANKKATENNIKKAEFEFMLDLKTLISKTAIDPELTRVRTSMRREDRKTIPDGYRTVFDKLSIRWGLIFVDDQIIIPIDLGRRLLDILLFGHSGITKMTTEPKFSGGWTKNRTSKRKSRIVQNA